MKDKKINDSKQNREVNNKRKVSLVFYDAIIHIAVVLFIFVVSSFSLNKDTLSDFACHIVLSALCIFLARNIFSVYKQVWRYGGSTAYIRLIMADAAGGVIYYLLQFATVVHRIEFVRVFSVVALSLLAAIGIRLVYLYLYECAKKKTELTGFIWKFFSYLSGSSIAPANVDNDKNDSSVKIKIAIFGAGNVGVLLAEELLKNPRASYVPCCFVDIDKSKIGREVMGIRVLADRAATRENLTSLGVQEIVIALPQIAASKKKELYERYRDSGFKLKIYDYPVMQTAENGRRQLRQFDIEELLFRPPVVLKNEKTKLYYKDKVVLITGGGGSIGSELCRQIAKMDPKCIVILDVYENGAYDVQQELRIAYGGRVDVRVEILSVCDKRGLEKVFDTYHPDILLHAAAHKHVPLMEHNCCEAVKNNVFGTLNTVELAVKYKVGRFMMVSTDKAVNPTNVMGATKRMCEMIVNNYSSRGTSTVFSATRFGNVLGSAGSVIPLFKRQILNGSPLTVTDKRIIRYFMTIPEASQLVLESGSMANNGELFVLDMGKPVRILELAENMIRLSGFEPYKDIDIIETGLRPGEKLYEELLVKTEELDKTENSMIFIERDEAISTEALNSKLELLRNALADEDDLAVKNALMEVVPTFRRPEEVNHTADSSDEMKAVMGKENKQSVQDSLVVG